MRQSLRRFSTSLATGVLALAGGAAVAILWRGEGVLPAFEAPGAVGGASEVGVTLAKIAEKAQMPELSSGNALVEEMLAVMERRPNVSAKVRQRVRVGADELLGGGEYFQQGVGNQRRSRWELKTQVAGETASLVQLLDGRYLWTDRRLAKVRQVTRVDLERLRRDLTLPVHFGATEASSGGIDAHVVSARGGISQLLAELLREFHFSTPQEVRRGSKDAWAVVGSWRPTELVKLWPSLALADGGSVWPDPLPHHVLMVIGRDDLFPYVLEYRRYQDASLADQGVMGGAAADPLARYEWFDVRFESTMDAKHFVYSTSDVIWSDETARVLSELQSPALDALPVASRHDVFESSKH